MVLAWYMDDFDTDQRLEHHKDPKEFVSLKDLESIGILYCKIKPDLEEDKLDRIKAARGYSYSDFLEVSPEKLLNYEEKLRSFFIEHIHRDEEIRYILDGAGYFDVRDKSDKWIRILVETGDFIIVPAGIYHRFTLDIKNYIKVRRFFVGEAVWTPFNRPDADNLEERKKYLQELCNGFPINPLNDV